MISPRVWFFLMMVLVIVPPAGADAVLASSSLIVSGGYGTVAMDDLNDAIRAGENASGHSLEKLSRTWQVGIGYEHLFTSGWLVELRADYVPAVAETRAGGGVFGVDAKGLLTGIGIGYKAPQKGPGPRVRTELLVGLAIPTAGKLRAAEGIESVSFDLEATPGPLVEAKLGLEAPSGELRPFVSIGARYAQSGPISVGGLDGDSRFQWTGVWLEIGALLQMGSGE